MILPELSTFDVLGANGCNFLTPRCNLLVEFQQILLDDDTIKMWFDQFSPEGFGIGHCKTLPPCQTKIWIFSVLEQTSGLSFLMNSQLGKWLRKAPSISVQIMHWNFLVEVWVVGKQQEIF